MVVAPQPPPPQGQWVNTAQYGWIWVPAGTTSVAIGDVPSVYMYTPTYGWTWYASPWGWGPFAYGAWVSQPGAFGFRVWHRGAYGWGWHMGPRVNVQVGGGYPGYYGHPRRHYYGGHRSHWGGRHHRR